MWLYNATEFAYVGQVYMLVIPTLLLVLTSYAITPEVPADRTLDLREYYMANRKKVFIPLAAFMLSAYVADLVILGVGVWEWTLLLSATSASLVLALAFTRNLWVHRLVVVAVSVLLVLTSLQPNAGVEQNIGGS